MIRGECVSDSNDIKQGLTHWVIPSFDTDMIFENLWKDVRQQVENDRRVIFGFEIESWCKKFFEITGIQVREHQSGILEYGFGGEEHYAMTLLKYS